jgi:DNA-binding PadR family transcriptional regulator
MIELAILGLLTDQDLHGYELKKQLGELLGSWSTMSFGSLYPALARLEKAGLVKAVEANTAPPEVAVPMTGALSGELAAFRQRLAPKATKPPRGRRGKKVYGITATGRERFHELLTEAGPDDERTFALRVAFCRELEPAERLALFERRKAELTGQLAARRKPAERRGDLYRRSLRDRDARTISLDLEWLDELAAATHAEEISARPDPATRPSPISPVPATTFEPTPGIPADAV